MMMSEITHFLNQEGRAEFPRWFEELQRVLATQRGFRAVRAFCDPEDETTRVICLEMDSAEATAEWVSGADKPELLERIGRWSVRPYAVRRLTPIGSV